jgi:hypothetical protein
MKTTIRILTILIITSISHAYGQTSKQTVKQLPREALDTIYITDIMGRTHEVLIPDSNYFRVQNALTKSQLLYADTSGRWQTIRDSLLTYLNDSTVFHTYDSLYFAMRYARNTSELLFREGQISDSLYQATHDVLDYWHQARNEEAITFLEDRLTDSSFHRIPAAQDSIYNIQQFEQAVRGILRDLPGDSLVLRFYSNQQDSVDLILRRNQQDSTHIKIFDARNEYANMWLKARSKHRVDIDLEDDVFINKPQRQKTVKKGLEIAQYQSSIAKTEKVNIIIPIWEMRGNTNFLINQGYVKNWVEGGENSLSALSLFQYNIDYTYGKKAWNTVFEYKFGVLQTGNSSIRKNDDRFEVNSKYGTEAFKKWYYSALFNFKTQLWKGYNYPNDSVPVSGFMAPGHLVFSLGLDYKPNKNFTLLLSPVTSKFTIVRDTAKYDQTSYGVGANEKMRKEIGAYIKTRHKMKLWEDIHMENRLNLFTNYTNNPQNVDIDWELKLDFKLNDFITTTINLHLLYDDDVDIPVYNWVDGEQVQVGTTQKIQFKEVLGIGFVYKFYR